MSAISLTFSFLFVAKKSKDNTQDMKLLFLLIALLPTISILVDGKTRFAADFGNYVHNPSSGNCCCLKSLDEPVETPVNTDDEPRILPIHHEMVYQPKQRECDSKIFLTKYIIMINIFYNFNLS